MGTHHVGRGMQGCNSLGQGSGSAIYDTKTGMDKTGLNKRRAEENGRDGGKHERRAINLQTGDETNDNERKSVRDVMYEHGMNATNAEGGFKTQIKMEWVLEKECTTFSVRSAVIGAVKMMKKVDKKLRIISSVDGEMWEEIDDIPKGEDFTAAFDAKQERFGKDGIRFKVFATLVFQIRLNSIKFESNVYNYL